MAQFMPDRSPEMPSEVADLAAVVGDTVEEGGNGFDVIRKELSLEMNRDLAVKRDHPVLGTAAVGGRWNLGWSTLGVVFAIAVVGGGALLKTFIHHLERWGVSTTGTDLAAAAIVVAVLAGVVALLRRPLNSWSLARTAARR